MKKRVLSLLIVLCLVTGMIPAVSSATHDNGFTYEVYEDHVAITGYEGEPTEIVIPTEIEELPVTVIDRWAFDDCYSLTSISIPDSITDIGDYAFSGCSSLTNITIPASVTSISSNIFYGCSSLTSISIPATVTSIGSSAFSHCSSLTSISIPDGVHEICTSTFYGCSSLSDISIPNSVTLIGSSAFSHCSNLSSISIPDSVTQIGGGAFSRCSSLASISIPASVTQIGDGAFSYCLTLTNITIPDGITEIGDSTFENCSNLSSISIPDSLTRIDRFAFNGCTNLTSISLPNNVTYIGEVAFQDCSNLTSISIPYSVTHIGESAFNACSSLVEIVVDENNPNYSSDERGLFFNKDKTELIQAPGAVTGSYVIPDNVTHIADLAFSGCFKLSSISIPNSVTRIGGFAFLNCAKLSSIRFLGDAPEMDNGAYSIFGGVTATAYYPTENSTWTADVMQNYGGNITWVPYNPSNPFLDVPVGAFYEKPVLWALENGITTGATADTFNPGGQCLRAHVVTFLHRAAENPEPASTKNPFTDVKTTDFFCKPVLWAVEQGITNGLSATQFGPNAACNRAQVVTFLYRAYND